MKVKKVEPNIAEPTLPLSSIQPGEVFRFAHDSFEDALKSDLFFLRIDAPELKERVRIVNLKDGKPMERDGIHRVVKHEAALSVA